MSSNNKNGQKSNKLTYAVIIVFFIVVVLFGAKDHLTKLTGNENVTGGYVTVAEAKNLMREFIEENPELIIRSLEKLQQKKFEEQAQKQKDRIVDNKDKIISSNYPVLGNKDGDVTVVKFFDYRCGHCKTAHKTLESLMKQDSNFKVILRVVPVLGPQSEKAARASLAAFTLSPSKFTAFHEKLINANSYNENNIKKMAQESGYDASMLVDKMDSKEVTDLLNSNSEAAGLVGVRGVPGFLIGEEFIPGNLPEDAFKEKIQKARAK